VTQQLQPGIETSSKSHKFLTRSPVFIEIHKKTYKNAKRGKGNYNGKGVNEWK